MTGCMDVDEDGEIVPQLRNIEVKLKGGSIKPIHDYFRLLDDLCDVRRSRDAVQFHSIVGLGRAALTGLAIGAVMSVHLCGALYLVAGHGLGSSARSKGLLAWCLYMMYLCFYHLSEFFVTIRYNAPIGSFTSFLLDQSLHYQIAMVASWVEFFLELLLFPSLKGSTTSVVSMFIGLIMMTVGQFFRTGAMTTAKSNFTHLIQFEKNKNHRLVTDGLYKYIRHPSYFGWFWWSIGTQFLLCNPICVVAYAAVAWKFFSVRIPVEEDTLIRFFPEYVAYKDRTPTGIPFLG